MSSLFGQSPHDVSPLKDATSHRAQGTTPKSKRKELDQVLTGLYEQQGITLDALPYTQSFESLYTRYREAAGLPELTRKDVFHRLHNLRKAAKLPRLGRSTTTPIKVSDDDEQRLKELIIERIGTVGQRDQLPYDPRIDDLAQVFNTVTGRSLTQADIWRLIAKIAK